jgi:putative PIN family toxin of toxin-antitoxin system
MNAMQMHPAVVLDTNVVLDWMVFHDPRVAPLADAIAAGRLLWLGSSRMLAELAHVLARPALASWSPKMEQVLTLVNQLIQSCDDPASCGLVCCDASDQVFIDLALAQRARWLFTRDKALLRLARQALPRGTIVCTPEDWQAATAATATT